MKPVLRVLNGEAVWPPPVWMMRQAGRYLPEYRELRAQAPSFLDFCYDSEKAAEVTLQPIRRFGFDAAILFSDILVIPHALGQEVSFEQGEGPKLDPIVDGQGLARLEKSLNLDRLSGVFGTLERVKTQLPDPVTLLGFCGAPWTVASYMIAGKGTPDQAPARSLAYTDSMFLEALIERLIEASSAYLIAQFEAGAEAVQIFESFGAALPPALFEKLSADPIARIIEKVRAAKPDAKIIVFVRGGAAFMPLLAQKTKADALALDWSVDLNQTLPLIPESIATQGNLDPLALVAGGEALRQGVEAVLKAVKHRPHIFNLGHGIVPQTPIAHVEAMLAQIRRG